MPELDPVSVFLVFMFVIGIVLAIVGLLVLIAFLMVRQGKGKGGKK